MADQKDTIYIDIDDEITSIIEKVRGSEHKILALVLPKRATTLQSIVNMKLLKRMADQSKKKIVLITSESGLLPLAGAVGLHVAKTLQSKPAIPSPPDMSKAEEPLVAAEEIENDELELDESKSVGELAGLSDEPKAQPAEETIDIDNLDEDDEASTKGKKNSKSKIKIPDFNKFRLRLILGIVGFVGLIVLLFVMFRVLPKTTVTIQTNNQSINASPSITVNTGVKAVDLAGKIVPATMKDVKITATQKSTATGKKNTGQKAFGTISVSTVCTAVPDAIPAGTAATANGLTFTTTQVLSLSNLSSNGSQIVCSGSVPIVASQGGSNFNLAADSSFTIAGYTGANDDALSGGTDNVITVLSQADIDEAKQKIASNTTQAQKDLTKSLKAAGFLPVGATLVSDEPSVSTSANAGDQVSDVSVTVVTNYHMLGVKQSDLEKIVNDDIKSQIDTKKQEISNYGLANASYTLTNKKSNTEQVLTLKTTVVTWAQIDTASLKKQIAGKKAGDVRQLIENLPSVKKVDVKYSPFWITTVSRKTSSITIVVQNVPTTDEK